MAQKLFIGSLSFSTSTERLRELFAEVGAVESAAVVMDRDTGRSRGFVEMATAEEAHQAVKRFNGHELDGRQLSLTPYPGTLTWYELKKADRIVSFDWQKYDQANVVYKPARMTGDQLRLGQTEAYETFYSPSSMARRFPVRGARRRIQWTIYNLFMKKGAATDRKDAVAPPTPAPEMVPMPPILPLKREWREAVLEATESPARSA